MRRVVLIVLTLGLVLVVWFAGRYRPAERAHVELEPALVPKPAPRHEPDLDTPEPTRSVDKAGATEAAREPTEARQVAAVQPGGKLHGRVIVVDDAGIEHVRENGTVELSASQSFHRKSVQAEVVDGSWTSDIDSNWNVRVPTARLGEREAYESPSASPRVVGPDGYVELRMTWTMPIVVYARDAARNFDLDQVEVFLADDKYLQPTAVPDLGSGKFEVRLAGSSPLTITPLHLLAAREAQTIYVRARGYGWAFARFDRRGGDVLVELHPAASLSVELEGEWQAKTCVLRVSRSTAERPLLERDVAAAGRFTFEAMEAGAYRVAVELGKWYGSPFVLAETTVTLPPGKETRIILPVSDRDLPEGASLSGTIRVPNAWKTAFLGVNATRCTDRGSPPAERASISKDRVKNADATLYTWSFSALPVGRYVLSTDSPPFAAVVELKSGGTSGVVLEIPPPAQVALIIVDTVSHEPVPEPLMLRWAVRTAGRIPDSAWSNVRRGSLELSCPVGEIVLSSNLLCFSGYDFPARTLTVVPGRNEFTIEIQRVTGLTVQCLDGQREIGLESEDAVEIAAVDGDGSLQICGTGGSRVVAFASKPGKYRVRLKTAVPGFVLPDVQIVELEPAKMTDVVIALTRR